MNEQDARIIERAWAEDAAGETIPGEVVKAILAGESPLRVWRKHRELTLDALAERVGVSKGYLSQVENLHKDGTRGLILLDSTVGRRCGCLTS